MPRLAPPRQRLTSRPSAWNEEVALQAPRGTCVRTTYGGEVVAAVEGTPQRWRVAPTKTQAPHRLPRTGVCCVSSTAMGEPRGVGCAGAASDLVRPRATQGECVAVVHARQSVTGQGRKIGQDV